MMTEDEKFRIFIRTDYERFMQIKNFVAGLIASEGKEEYRKRYGEVAPIEAIKKEWLKKFK